MPTDDLQAFQTKLDRYAELAVKVWLNVQPSQRLVITAPIETTALVRLLAKHAYLNGSPYVNILWEDGESTRIRYQYAKRDSFDEYPAGLVETVKIAIDRGDALMSITGQDPDLLKGLDGEFIAKVAKSTSERMRELAIKIGRNDINWLGLGMATSSWAARVFPDTAPEQQVEKLWHAIFQVCRLNEPDPIGAWQKHIAELDMRCRSLNGKQYASLHYTGPGTDLHVQLLAGHRWIGGGETSAAGIRFMPNIPTEEIFTAPHCLGTRGYVTTTKPLAVRGVVINSFTLTFEAGSVVKVEASNNQEVLDSILDTDQGARRLGEVALVPAGSPISMSGLIYYNTLFDENAASHLALGRAYPNNLLASADLSPQELLARGVNESLVHIDFMIGSNALNIDGITVQGQAEAVMRNGEWAFGV